MYICTKSVQQATVLYPPNLTSWVQFAFKQKPACSSQSVKLLYI